MSTQDDEAKPGRQSKCWICDDCATKKKWVPPTGAVTAISGLCDWCDRPDVVTLIPVIDYNRGGVPWD